MNRVLRILRLLLWPFGIDVRRRNTHNLRPYLQPFKNASNFTVLATVRDYFVSDDDLHEPRTADINILKICFRTCLTTQRAGKGHGMVAGASLPETVARCFLTLIRSVNLAAQLDPTLAIEVMIIDDHSEDSLINPIKTLAQRLACPWRFHTPAVRGPGASLYEQFGFAADDNALYYFCEDDYLHDERAIFEMVKFYQQLFSLTGRHVVLAPQEHELLYGDCQYPSYLVVSPYRHWRSCSHATHVLFTHAHAVQKYWRFFENTKFVGNRKKRHLGSEKRTTNLLFNHVPCFAPLPALAGHFQTPDLLPPVFNWRALWDANDPAKLPPLSPSGLPLSHLV